MAFWAVMLIVVPVGALGGLVTLWIGAFLVKHTGAWIGGVADSAEVRAALAWGSVPTVLNLFFWVPLLLVIGSEMFTANTPRIAAQTGLAVLLTVLALAMLLMNLWSLILTCNTLAEVQEFRSAWKGLGNILVAALVVFAIIMVVAILLFGISSIG